MCGTVAIGASPVQQQHGLHGHRTKWVDHDCPADTLACFQRWLDQPRAPPEH